MTKFDTREHMLETLKLAYRYILGPCCSYPLTRVQQRELGRRLASYQTVVTKPRQLVTTDKET